MIEPQITNMDDMPQYWQGTPMQTMIPEGFLATYSRDDDGNIIGITMWEVGCLDHAKAGEIGDELGFCSEACNQAFPICTYMFRKNVRQDVIFRHTINKMLEDQMFTNTYMVERVTYHA